MKNRLRINLFIGIVAVLFIIVLVISNVGIASVNMAVVPGSYGETYAKRHHINSLAISDSEKNLFDQRYELFDYDYDKTGITIEKYTGSSETLVIPISINGEIVTGIGENFFKDLNSSVKNIYLPETIIFVEAEPTDKVNIYCSDSSIFKYLEGDREWKIETKYDSELVNFLLGDLEFEYNNIGNGVEITRYTGNATDLIVFPSYINGAPVKSISMDMLGVANGFVIPETVTSITGRTTKAVYGATFAIQLIFTIIAFVLSLVSVNIILPRFKKNNGEYLLSSSQMIVTILYVLLQAAFCIVVVYFVPLPLLISIAVSGVLLIVFVAVSFLGGAGREHSKEVSEKIEEKTNFMRDLKESTKYLADGIEDPEAKKTVQGLVDEIRFSKLSSSDDKTDMRIAAEIKELEELIAQKEYSDILDKCNSISGLIKKR